MTTKNIDVGTKVRVKKGGYRGTVIGRAVYKDWLVALPGQFGGYGVNRDRHPFDADELEVLDP